MLFWKFLLRCLCVSLTFILVNWRKKIVLHHWLTCELDENLNRVKAILYCTKEDLPDGLQTGSIVHSSCWLVSSSFLIWNNSQPLIPNSEDSNADSGIANFCNKYVCNKYCITNMCVTNICKCTCAWMCVFYMHDQTWAHSQLVLFLSELWLINRQVKKYPIGGIVPCRKKHFKGHISGCLDSSKKTKTWTVKIICLLQKPPNLLK